MDNICLEILLPFFTLILHQKNGTGHLNFVDFTVIINDDIVNIHREDVPFTYILGLRNGYATVTLPNFPVAGQNPTSAVSFQSHHDEIVGFSQLTINNNVPTARWTLGTKYPSC